CERGAERGERLDEEGARLYRIKTVLQLRMVARHDRVGYADRRRWRADALRSHGHERMFDRVARQDHERARRSQSAFKQGLRDVPGDARALGIGDLAPSAAPR